MPTFDATKQVLRCAVHDLLDSDGAHAGYPAGSRQARARLGTQVHQDARALMEGDGSVSAEVAVHWHFVRDDGWRVEIDGRIDMLRSTPDGLDVIEVKSSFLSGGDLASMPPLRSHREQCGFYCLMLRRNGRAVRQGWIRYRSLTDGQAYDADIRFEPDAVERLLHARLDAMFVEYRRRLARAGRKRMLAGNLAFPFPGRREGQTCMMERVAGVADDGGILFCSAPTGIGKTVAALYPMTRAALDRDMRLFFVTAKVSQQELAVDTLRQIIPSGSGVCGMQLTAKERSCPADEMHCDSQECPYLADFQVRLEQSGLLDRLEDQGTVSGEALAASAAAARLCPFEVSLALANRAAVIISDYNYVFDPHVALKSFFDDPSALPMLLAVDEAHNLPDRVRGYYSPQLDVAELRRVAGLCAAQPVAVYGELARLFSEVADNCDDRLQGLRQEQPSQAVWLGDPDRVFFRQMAERSELLTMEYLTYRRQQRKHRPPVGLEPEPRAGSRRLRDPVLNACFVIRDYGECCAYDPERFAGLWYPDGTARIWCLDPSPFVRQRLDYFNGTVLMSATLSPFEFFLRMTGLAEHEVGLLDIPSPFPAPHRLIAADPSIDTRYRMRDRSAATIADIIHRAVQLRQGNYLAFFPSFAFRDQVVAALPAGGAYRTVIQTPAMPTARVLESLEANLVETILVCAVQGGVFAEGVDYPGHLAVGAFIVGPGLPKVCPEQELIRNYHDQLAGDGFRHAYLYPGLNRVVQAGGRIIRTESDRGFILLLDRRLASDGYRRKMPGYWRDEMQIVTDSVAAVEAFWRTCD